MGSSGSKTNKTSVNKKQELFTGHMFVPIEITNKVLKSVCKITVKNQGKANYGTGFFINLYDSKKYLLTNHHIISNEIKKEDIVLEIHNHKTMNLELNNRYIKYFPKPKDITIIEIEKTDKIYNDIELLDYDTNYIRKDMNFIKMEIYFQLNIHMEKML